MANLGAYRHLFRSGAGGGHPGIEKLADALPVVLEREDHRPKFLKKVVGAAKLDAQLARLEVDARGKVCEPRRQDRLGRRVPGDLRVLPGGVLEHAVEIAGDALAAGD